MTFDEYGHENDLEPENIDGHLNVYSVEYWGGWTAKDPNDCSLLYYFQAGRFVLLSPPRLWWTDSRLPLALVHMEAPAEPRSAN